MKILKVSDPYTNYDLTGKKTLTSDELKKRWKISDNQLIRLILHFRIKHQMPSYYFADVRSESSGLEDVFFLAKDVLEFERLYPEFSPHYEFRKKYCFLSLIFEYGLNYHIKRLSKILFGWDKVTIRVVCDTRIETSSPAGEKIYSYSELGLERKPVLKKILESLAKGQRVTTDDKQNIYNLRKIFQDIFPLIVEDPFPLKGDTYQTAFKIEFTEASN